MFFVDAEGNQIMIDDPEHPGQQIPLTADYFKDAKDELAKLRENYTKEPDPQKKQELNEQIKQLENETYSAMETLRQEGKLTEAYRYYNGGVLFSNHGDNNDGSNITAKNISISKGWATEKVRLLNTKVVDGKDHSTADDNITHLWNLMNEQMDYFAGTTIGDASQGDKRFFHGTFQQRLADINIILSSDHMVSNLQYEDFTSKALNLENSRQSVSGVDLNDEATSMMTFQKSYSAACQLMTTLDSMLDKLINDTMR